MKKLKRIPAWVILCVGLGFPLILFPCLIQLMKLNTNILTKFSGSHLLIRLNLATNLMVANKACRKIWKIPLQKWQFDVIKIVLSNAGILCILDNRW